MAFMSMEGEIEVPLEDFWEWLRTQHPDVGGYMHYGVPRINAGNKTIEITFAACTEEGAHPKDWAVKPKAVTEWDDCEKTVILKKGMKSLDEMFPIYKVGDPKPGPVVD